MISVVVPIFCEANNLLPLFAKFTELKDQFVVFDWEFICVNDGSTDNSITYLCEQAQHDTDYKIIDLSRNFGKEIALTAGVFHAKGDAVICIDADLQHPPEIIADMLQHWQAGADTVIGVRDSDADQTFWRRTCAWLFYKIMALVSEVDFVPRATDFRLMDRKVIEAFKSMGERERIFRGLVDWLGFKKVYIQFVTPKRYSGTPGYSYRKLWNLAVHSLLSHSHVPLRLVAYLGVIITCVSSGLLLWMQFAIVLVSPTFFYTPLAKFVVFNTWLIGVTLTALGIIAFYTGKIYLETAQRPLFAIRQTMNLPQQPYDNSK